MAVVPYIVAYLAIAAFVIALIARIIMWQKMPIHLRWELYPVAHEKPERVKYGGSYLEELDWWKKPIENNKVEEMKHMIPEMLFMVAVKEYNPKLWNRTFPFHFGLYLTAACAGLLLFASILVGTDLIALEEAILPPAFLWPIKILGIGGMGLAIIGALALLHRRLSSHELRMYSAPADFFNLIFFIGAFGLMLTTVLVFDPNFAIFTAFASGLVTFNMVALPGEGLAAVLPIVSIVVVSALLAYIPMTHMSHFIGKYFSYHAIRWNDEPNLKGGHQEAAINSQLVRPISWSASHIQGDGKKTWAEVATQEEVPE